MAASIFLTFHGEKPQLTQSIFSRPGHESRLCVRGKTCGSYQNAGTFQWTSAVRGLCVLFLKGRLAHLNPALTSSCSISGFKDSIAASLDYALVKQPEWLRDMFGVDAVGNTYARRLIAKTNSQRKLPGPVTLAVNDKTLALADIHIVWNESQISSEEQLQELISRIDEVGHVSQVGVGATVGSKALAA